MSITIFPAFSLQLGDLAMVTARPRKTSFENQKLWSCDYLAIIPPSLNRKERRLRKWRELKNSHYFYVYFVVKSANVVISRCCFVEDGRELFQSACRTCNTRIFYLTNQILNL